MTSLPRRHWLLGASALPAALLLSGCDGIDLPFLGRSPEPGSCLGPSEELPEEVHRTIPDGMQVDPGPADPEVRFVSRSLALSPDGSLLAACETSTRHRMDLADAYGVILWDTATGEVLRRIEPPTSGLLAWHPEGQWLAIAASRYISIVDLEGNLEWNLIGHELPEDEIANIRDIAFSPNGNQLASSGSDRTVRLWDLDGDACGAGHVLEPGHRSNSALSYSPDGSTLAVGSTSTSSESDPHNPPELWDPAAGERLQILEDLDGNVFDLEYDADGTLLVVTDEPTTLTLIRADGTREQGPVTDSARFAELAIGPRQRIAVRGGYEELLIWDRETGEETRLEIEMDVSSMRWAPDESALYCLSGRDGVSAWDGQEWRAFDLP